MDSIVKACKAIQEMTNGFRPEVGIILGTGLGGFVDSIDVEYRLEYKDIPNMPVSTVEGHKGCLIFGTVGGKKVVAMQGRFHYYEGYTLTEISKLLGLPVPTVGTRLTRGREKLRNLLKEDYK